MGAEREGRYTLINSAQIYYELKGEGRTVIFAHAGIADSRMWDAQFDAFSRHYRVLRYDLRGFGKSKPVAGEFSHSDDLKVLLDALQIDRASLIGCSNGVRVVFDFATLYPERVEKIVAVAGTPGGYPYPEDTPGPPQWDEIATAAEAGDIERINELEIQIWVDGLGQPPDRVDPALRKLALNMNLMALRNEEIAKTEELRLEPPAFPRLAELRAPVMFVIGDLDVPWLVDAVHHLAERIESAEKVVIGGTAHLPNMERPHEFNEAVLGFLGD